MNRAQTIAVLRAHEAELRATGVVPLALCGSVARGETTAHDVDIAVWLDERFSRRGLDFFSRLDDLEGQLAGILGCEVDVVEEPVRGASFQKEIDRDRAVAL
jgi:uncharacterized protein